MLVAVLGVLVRATMPMPSEASSSAGPAILLGLPGVALCHTDNGPTDHAPGKHDACDHCPLCTASLLGAALIPTVADVVQPATTAMPRQVGFLPRFQARAPPRRIHYSRAPPAI
jgi:hypothetical protein